MTDKVGLATAARERSIQTTFNLMPIVGIPLSLALHCRYLRTLCRG